jgi:hypothetical protein
MYNLNYTPTTLGVHEQKRLNTTGLADSRFRNCFLSSGNRTKLLETRTYWLSLFQIWIRFLWGIMFFLCHHLLTNLALSVSPYFEDGSTGKLFCVISIPCFIIRLCLRGWVQWWLCHCNLAWIVEACVAKAKTGTQILDNFKVVTTGGHLHWMHHACISSWSWIESWICRCFCEIEKYTCAVN